MQIFLSAFDDIPDPQADTTRHVLGELLVIASVAVLCGATTCAGMATFGRAKKRLFRGVLNLKHAVPTHDTFPAIFRMLDPRALDAAFGKVLAVVAALMRDGDCSPSTERRCGGHRARRKARAYRTAGRCAKSELDRETMLRRAANGRSPARRKAAFQVASDRSGGSGIDAGHDGLWFWPTALCVNRRPKLGLTQF
ncbi:transposase family protein [Poseidonocella sp. HB161398]|uniref:transposase family protein n=1 Tax=Poseidonocella sp. HB161398 TaxID=2320855 RepID=UPI001981E12F|nr:transposase family protein [Poseidonocella sp. HB161398]